MPLYLNFGIEEPSMLRILQNGLVASCSTIAKPRLILFGGQGTQEKGMLDKILAISEAKAEIQKYSDLMQIDFQEITTTDHHNLIGKTYITQPLLVLSHVLYSKYML